MGGEVNYQQFGNGNWQQGLPTPFESGCITVGNIQPLGGGLNPFQDLYKERKMAADGTKPVVICNGCVTEAKDLDDAQRIAEEQAHAKSANAYILKPVRQVAPKRDVVTTDLP